MLIACLDFQNTSDGTFRYQAFSNIAKELGHDLISVSHDGSLEAVEKAYAKAGQLIKDAAAFFIPNARIFDCMDESHPAHSSKIQDRIKTGAHILVTPFFNQPALDYWNRFLAPFDLTVSTIRIHPTIFRARAEASHDLTIKRSAHSFRDVRLFQGVDEVVLRQPVAIWYSGESLPILCATENEMPVDGTTDLLPIPDARKSNPSEVLPSEWNARELACMAMWYGENDGAVLVSRGPSFFDPYTEQNRRLVANVVRFLCESSSEPLSAEQRYGLIEVNLVNFVLRIVRDAAGDDWWAEMIPLPIRTKCAQRQEQEGCRLRKEAYFDLIDLKDIMQKQWKLFDPHLRAVGCDGGKEKSLKWLDDLNALRRMVGHPLKKHFAGSNFSKEDHDLLSVCHDLAHRLLLRTTPKE